MSKKKDSRCSLFVAPTDSGVYIEIRKDVKSKKGFKPLAHIFLDKQDADCAAYVILKHNGRRFWGRLISFFQ